MAAYIVRNKDKCLRHQALHRDLDREMMRGRGADHIFFSNFTPIIGQADPRTPNRGFVCPVRSSAAPTLGPPALQPPPRHQHHDQLVRRARRWCPAPRPHRARRRRGDRGWVGFWDCRLHRHLPCPTTPLGIHHKRRRHHRPYPSQVPRMREKDQGYSPRVFSVLPHFGVCHVRNSWHPLFPVYHRTGMALQNEFLHVLSVLYRAPEPRP